MAYRSSHSTAYSLCSRLISNSLKKTKGNKRNKWKSQEFIIISHKRTNLRYLRSRVEISIHRGILWQIRLTKSKNSIIGKTAQRGGAWICSTPARRHPRSWMARYMKCSQEKERQILCLWALVTRSCCEATKMLLPWPTSMHERSILSTMEEQNPSDQCSRKRHFGQIWTKRVSSQAKLPRQQECINITDPRYQQIEVGWKTSTQEDPCFRHVGTP